MHMIMKQKKVIDVFVVHIMFYCPMNNVESWFFIDVGTSRHKLRAQNGSIDFYLL
jgi:hypothetical protein